MESEAKTRKAVEVPNVLSESTELDFNFHGCTVRTVMIDGEPYFVARDVATVLGYADTTNAIKTHCKGVAIHHPLMTGGGMQQVRVIAEADVLRLIVSSRLPSAVEFERTVFEEILPSIRRTGSYGQPSLSDEQIVAQALQITTRKVRELEAKVEADAPKVDYFEQCVAPEDDVVTLRVAAQQIGVPEKRLREAMVEAGWINRTKVGVRWSESKQKLETEWEYRAGSKHREKFALRAQHNAPRHHNGQVRQTLYVLAAAIPAIARRFAEEVSHASA